MAGNNKIEVAPFTVNIPRPTGSDPEAMYRWALELSRALDRLFQIRRGGVVPMNIIGRQMLLAQGGGDAALYAAVNETLGLNTPEDL